MPLFQVSIRIAGDQVDALEDLLFEADDGHWNIYLDHDTQRGVASGVYDSEADAQSNWERIYPFLREVIGKVEPAFEELPDEDWKESYKIHFKPWSLEGLHWVPVWERENYKVPDEEAVVWLDPGMAFGTGNHETTRLCVEALIGYLKERGRQGLPLEGLSCCDAGCGSGILAISARKLGISTVVGFDNDPDAIRVSHENKLVNALAGQVEFWEGDLMSGFKSKSYHLVFANILAAVLVKHPYALLASVKSGGRLVLSGILTRELEEVRGTYKEKMARMNKVGTMTSGQSGEWSSLIIDLA